MSQMANGKRVASGTYVPETDSVTFTIDTGRTDWTHFLICVHSLPYESGFARCLGLRYADLNNNLLLCLFGSSSDSNAVPNGGVSYYTSTDFNYYFAKDGTLAKFIKGIASTIGKPYIGAQYDWYVW